MHEEILHWSLKTCARISTQSRERRGTRTPCGDLLLGQLGWSAHVSLLLSPVVSKTYLLLWLKSLNSWTKPHYFLYWLSLYNKAPCWIYSPLFVKFSLWVCNTKDLKYHWFCRRFSDCETMTTELSPLETRKSLSYLGTTIFPLHLGISAPGP